jgi:NTP pyrophosphatase (non-canonical NTP hydrolase)
MNKFLDDFIKDLSIKDKKTLSQKGLKLVEEVGELARAILPYDSAPGTNHRFSDREQILEEIVDVYLTNISIAHSLGFTDEEMNDMLNKKSKKWAELQAKEEAATFPLPFEIHITVDLESYSIKNFGLEEFKSDCVEINVKPIVLDLEMKEGTLKDVMTSSKHFGDNRSAYEEANRIANELTSLGYKVVRKKIETVPWHPAAPTFKTGEPIPNGCYFESHIGVVISPEEKPYLEGLVEELNAGFFSPSRGFSRPSQIELGGTCKLSQNFFKKSKDGSKFVNMLTYRDSMTCKEDFERDVELIKFLLNEDKFGFEKVEVEYALYDTNVNHDAKWILG